MRGSGSESLPIYKIERTLYELFKDWRELIKRRAGALPGSQEREKLDEIFYKVLPVIIRISEERTQLDISQAREILLENHVDFLESASGMPPESNRTPQEG